MTFYPAWMIPMAYAYLALVIWVFITDFKKCHLKWYDIVSIIAVLALFGGSMFYIFSMSGDTVNLVLNTAYPGKRTELGGGYMSGFSKASVIYYLLHRLKAFLEMYANSSIFRFLPSRNYRCTVRYDSL